jgi:hypothetical protein
MPAKGNRILTLGIQHSFTSAQRNLLSSAGEDKAEDINLGDSFTTLPQMLSKGYETTDSSLAAAQL